MIPIIGKDREENPVAMPSITHLLKALIKDYLNLPPSVQDAINQHAGAVARANLTRKHNASTQTKQCTVDAYTQTDPSLLSDIEDYRPIYSVKTSKSKWHWDNRAQENKSPMKKGNLESAGNFFSRKDVCWNCGGLDHFHSACPLPKLGRYCYGCGARNTVAKYCGCAKSRKHNANRKGTTLWVNK